MPTINCFKRRSLHWATVGIALYGFCCLAQPQNQPLNTPIAPAPAPLELVVLGSGGPGATGRAGTSYLLLLDGTPRVLVDAGAGAFTRLGESGLSMRQVDTVLLTHLHVDHTGGLPGLVKARAISSRGDIDFKIFGPTGQSPQRAGDGNFPGTHRFIDLLFGSSGAFSYLREFAGKIQFHAKDVVPSKRIQTLVNSDGLLIEALAGHHRDAPALIYRASYKNQSICFSGDIDPEGHDALVQMAKDCDLLVFNAVVLDPPGSPQQLYELHTAPADIGRLAKQAGVRQLMLSHLSPSLTQRKSAVLASIGVSYSGPIVWAEDGMRLNVASAVAAATPLASK